MNRQSEKTKASRVTFTKAQEEEWPNCPYCKQELREIKFKQRGVFTILTVFWCPHCRCLLGASNTFNG